METTVNFASVLGTCDQFTAKGKKEARNVVISPLKVTETDGQIKLNSGCSMWKACEKILGLMYYSLAWSSCRPFVAPRTDEERIKTG